MKSLENPFFCEIDERLLIEIVTKWMKKVIQIIKNGALNLLQNEINDGFDIKSKASDNSSLLHYSVKFNNFELTKFFLEKLLPVNEKNDKGITPLMIASENGNEKIIQLLLQYKANVDNTDNILFSYS